VSNSRKAIASGNTASARADGARPGSARRGLGSAGERLAAVELARRGYCIRELNYRSRLGEIDVVAEEAGELVFVEVKTRRGLAFGLPEEAVTACKQRKLREVAQGYLAEHGMDDVPWRVDVVAVQLSPAGNVQEVRVFRSAIGDVDA
jgi:putative endonuclease